jgi:hypothetical protein
LKPELGEFADTGLAEQISFLDICQQQIVVVP